IGDNSHQLLSIKEMELEVEYSPDLLDESKMSFLADTLSLNSFFSGLLYTINSTIDGLGRLNIKLNSLTGGSGYARAGRTKYIVQDNVAGRQMMYFDYNKVIVRDLLGNPLPTKTYTDSVLVKPAISVPTAIEMSTDEDVKIYPNPTTDLIRMEGMVMDQYRIYN